MKDNVFLYAAFMCPVAAGVAYMALAGAPHSYLFANMAAACLVLVAFWLVPPLDRQAALLAISVFVPALLASTFLGPAVDGVHRWIGIGPLKMHAGFLVLPFLATRMPRLDRWVVAAIISLAALLIALQPDRASAFALFLLAVVWFGIARNRWALMAFLASGGGLLWTISQADNLPPVRFVENVVAEAAAADRGMAVVMVGATLLAIAVPISIWWRNRSARGVGLIFWSICLAGYFLASLAGPYPVPLLGYGVSPILGFGYALALLARERNQAR